MAIDRVNAVLIGRVKDADGFSADLLEDPLTRARMLAYDPETWWKRGRLLEARAANARRRAVGTGTPTHCWPARPPRKKV